MSPNPALLTWPRPSGSTIIASDTFTRADSTTLGNLETGQTWLNTTGLFGVSSGRLYRYSYANTYECAYIQVTGNYRVSATRGANTGGGPMLIASYTKSSYYVAIRNGTLEIRNAGVFYSHGTTTLTAGDVLSIERIGNVFTAYKNGVQFGTISEAELSAEYLGGLPAVGRNVGIGGPQPTGNYYWDDFLVEQL